MADQGKVKNETLNELTKLRQRVAELEAEVTANAREGIVIYDRQFNYLVWNPYMETLTGVSASQALGKNAFDLFPHLREKGVDALLQRVLAGETVQAPDTFYHVPHTGRSGWVSAVYSPHFSSEGGISGVIGIIRDITERKRTEEALREWEERYRNLLETMEEGYFEVDLKGNFTFVNDSLCKMFNASSKDELIGLNYREYMDEETARKVYKIFIQVYNTRQPVKLSEWEVMRRDAKKALHESSIYLIRNAQGEPVGFWGILRDITERKKMEEALRETEDRYRDLVENSHDLICTHDLEGNILWINPIPAKILGYERNTLLKMNIRDVLAPEVQGQFSGYLDQMKRHGTAKGLMRVQTTRGERRIWEYNNTVRKEGVAAPLVRAIAHDITELKQMEEALRKGEEEAQRLAEENAILAEIGRIISSTLNIEEVYELFSEKVKSLLPYDRIVISMIDTEKSLVKNVYVSGEKISDRKVEEIYPLKGSGNAEMVGTKSTLLIQTEDVNEYKDHFPRLLSTFQAGFRSIMNVPLFSKGIIIGGLLLRSRKPYAYTDKDVKTAEKIGNQIAGAIANVQLFQEWKRVQGEFVKSEERYRSLVELSPLMIMVHKGKKYVYLNPAALKALGASTPEELVGRSIFEVIHPDYSAIMNERISLIEQGKAVPALEEKFIRLDKKIIDVEVTIAQTLYSGEPMALLMGRDITEQKKAEKEKAVLQEQLQQSQKMEAIGTLAGGIAHDFNNILSAISGYAELANLDIEDGSKAKLNLQQSMKAAYRAKDLVQQILSFSRQGRQERKPLNIKPIIKEGLKFLQASLPSTIEIRQDIEEDLGTIEADPTQIHQVLMNLCTNAAHAMNENVGALEVSLKKLDIPMGTFATSQGIEPGSYVRLRVSDTGNGMPPEILKRIFDPYFTTKEPGKGTGLGLAVVHGIMKSYGGGITVSSEVGKGSTFDIYFPRIEGMGEMAVSPDQESLPAGGHEHILFVDDEQTLVQMGQGMLTYLGYQITARTSSIEALELFRTKPEQFDLVITDMTMPNMTGDKLAIELSRIRPGIPIILCTGFSEYITKEKAQSMGIREFLFKPLAMKDLARAIRRVIDQNKGEA